MYHPVQKVVESLYAAGRCPRLHVNALDEGVVCPDEIRTRWRERLILDLDATYPLDLAYDEVGISADLSFGGVVTRCVFPWVAIYVVADRASGRGVVVDEHLPESVKRASQLPTTGPLPQRSDLRQVFDSRPNPSPAPSSAPPSEPRATPGPTPDPSPDASPTPARRLSPLREADAPLAGPDPNADTKPERSSKKASAATAEDVPQPRPPGDSESSAQARRAAFKIIDGGG